jgi:hypothetical protein
MQIQLKAMITYLQNSGRVLLGSLKKAKKNWLSSYSIDTTKKLEGYYQSIEDIPIYNWYKCLDGELKFVRTAKNGTKTNDLIVWERLHDEYIKEFGLSKVHAKILKVIKDKAIQELEYVITGDRFKLTLIEMEETRLKNILATAGSGVTVEEMIIHLSKWLGQWIKTKEISVKEFFTLQKEYERYLKAHNGKKDK